MFQMGPKHPGSTPLSGKNLPDGTQCAQGRGQTSGNPAGVYPHQAERSTQLGSQDAGPIGPPSSAPSTGPPNGASPTAQPGDLSDRDPDHGDTGATNSGATSGQGSGHKSPITPI